MKPYSKDLRERVVAAIDRHDDSRRKIAEQYQISISTLARWLSRRRKTCSLASRPHAGGQPPVVDAEPDRKRTHHGRLDHPRCGFTMIELLMVVLIIGLLMGIILPAVQSSREAARRAECTNHLKQIGVALAGFQASQGKFPSAFRREQMKEYPGKTVCSGCLSIQYHLLPFLDQTSLFNSMNVPLPSAAAGETSLSPPPYDRSNHTSHTTRLSVFLCPSDDDSLIPGNNYRGTVGPFPGYFEGSPWPGGGGAFPNFDGLSPADFTDGLSATVGFSERIMGSGLQNGYNRGRDYWYSGIFALGPSMMDGDRLMGACATLTDSTPSTWTRGGTWWSFANYSDTLYNHVTPPNWAAMDCSGSAKGSNGYLSGCTMSARSAHPGGVNGLLMDGSVRFFRNTIDLKTWRALSSRAGHDAVSAESF